MSAHIITAEQLGIVVWDPRGEVPLGARISGNRVSVYASKGVVMLPTHATLVDSSGVGGYALRHFGEGVTIPPGIHRPCKIALFVQPGYRSLVWSARIEGTAAVGRMRLATDTTQVGHLSGGVSGGPTMGTAIEGPPDEHGGWTIGAKVDYQSAGCGLLALCLYGTLSGGRVTWIAASQV